MRSDRSGSRTMTAVHGIGLRLVGLLLAAISTIAAATVSPLASAGYSVLPAPQQVTLNGTDFPLTSAWRIVPGDGVAADDIAIETLRDGFAERHHLRLGQAGTGGVIELVIRDHAVEIGAALDRDRALLAKQAYRLELRPEVIRITANAPAGLFYGAGTLLQLLTRRQDQVWLPGGEIVDWPDLQIRAIMWDDAHHLERIEALRRAIRTAAFFKINGFVLKLEGHFQFRSAPALVEPYALSPQEYQELTDYGLRHHVQVIPYLDAPAHLAFILKHPEYAGLRAFADSNYELDLVNPDSLKLLCGMYQDLIDANKGVDWFYLSTDESYYVGMSDNAGHSEAARQRDLGSAGKVLAEFLGKAGGWLRDHGRTPVFWGEHPIVASDVASCPPFLVSGCTNPELNVAFKERGIRQMVFTSAQGEERLFPDYAIASDLLRLHPRKDEGGSRVADAIKAIRTDHARTHGDLLGAIVAGWADSGLHPETFWLGYAAISAAAWNPAATDAASTSADFHRLFHGPSAHQAGRIYQLMSTQAQFWQDSWERSPSTSRSGIWGNSRSIFSARRPAVDETLPLPVLPAGGALGKDPAWSSGQARRLDLAKHYLAENEELCALLHEHLRSAESNRHTWEVFLSIAALCRQNLTMIIDIDRMHDLIADAEQAATKNPEQAVARLDQALAIAEDIKRERDAVLADATSTWYQTWCPRVPSANGRTFLHQVDDVKDHLPDRTVGMEYLVLRELLLPFGDWVRQIEGIRMSLAQAQGIPPRTTEFRWRDQ